MVRWGKLFNWKENRDLHHLRDQTRRRKISNSTPRKLPRWTLTEFLPSIAREYW